MAVIEAITTVYLEADGAEASYIIFDDIPSTYEHLEIRFSAQSDYASAGNDHVIIRLGDTGHSPVDTGANYSYHYMQAYGTTASAYTLASQTSISFLRPSAELAGAANFGSATLMIMDYTNTNKNTTLLGSSGMTSSLGSGANDVRIMFGSALWADTSVVNAIHLQPKDGGSWNRGSEFTLYGLNSS